MQYLNRVNIAPQQRLRQNRVENRRSLTAAEDQYGGQICFKLTAEKLIEFLKRFTSGEFFRLEQFRAHRHTDINDTAAAFIRIDRRKSGTEQLCPTGEYPVGFTDTGIAVMQSDRNFFPQCSKQNRSHRKRPHSQNCLRGKRFHHLY